MARSDIHPKQHEVTIQMTDGTKFNIKTTYGKPGETLKLDVDPKNHPAWKEGKTSFINVNDDRVSKFNKKFGNFDLGAVETTKAEAKEETPKAEAPKEEVKEKTAKEETAKEEVKEEDK